MPELYDDTKRIYPQRVNVKRLNAEFLDRYIFKGEIPVRTSFSRDNIELPVGIYVSNNSSRLKMMGFDYYGAANRQNFNSPDVKSSPWISFGVEAHGDVFVTVIATNPDIRDEVFARILSAYMSRQGRCWLTEKKDIVVHGYNLMSSSESDFDTTLDGRTNYLYTATLGIEFIYDIATTRILQYIEEIREFIVEESDDAL